jgi:hypothetical protein
MQTLFALLGRCNVTYQEGYSDAMEYALELLQDFIEEHDELDGELNESLVSIFAQMRIALNNALN